MKKEELEKRIHVTEQAVEMQEKLLSIAQQNYQSLKDQYAKTGYSIDKDLCEQAEGLVKHIEQSLQKLRANIEAYKNMLS